MHTASQERTLLIIVWPISRAEFLPLSARIFFTSAPSFSTGAVSIIDGGRGMLRTYYRSAKFLLRTVRRSIGKFPRECPLCDYRGKFLGYGYPYVCDIYCPQCGSLERHRLLCLATREHRFFADKEVLHFAPEIAITELVQKQGPRSYVTADLFAPNVDRKENIEGLSIADNSFDIVICLHVLEHVNDHKAIGELYRVLRPGGLLIAMFPIVEGWDETFEDTTVASTDERLLYFGQHDHVRFFGRDARTRLAAPGFLVEEYTGLEPNVSRYGLSRGEKVFVCRRPTCEIVGESKTGATSVSTAA